MWPSCGYIGVCRRRLTVVVARGHRDSAICSATNNEAGVVGQLHRCSNQCHLCDADEAWLRGGQMRGGVLGLIQSLLVAN